MLNYIYGNKLTLILRRYRRMTLSFFSLLPAWLNEDRILNCNATKESFVSATRCETQCSSCSHHRRIISMST